MKAIKLIFFMLLPFIGLGQAKNIIQVSNTVDTTLSICQQNSPTSVYGNRREFVRVEQDSLLIFNSLIRTTEFGDNRISQVQIKYVLGVDSLGNWGITKIDSFPVKWENVSGSPDFITTETDPLYNNSPAFWVTNQRIVNWDNAFLWGNHASASYLKGSDTISLNARINAKFNSPNGTSVQLIAGDGSIINPTKSTVGLSNVDNTSDINKPVSTAQQEAINAAAAGRVPYTSYHAIVSQSGTSAPTAQRKDTAFAGTTFTWARTGTGEYTITASNPVFTSGKTVVIMGIETAPFQKFTATITSTTVITINTNLQSVGLISLVATLLSNGTDEMLNNTLIEIRVYN